jgi:GR25 family glycosyltransferase involved in LPS biosynthesis
MYQGFYINLDRNTQRRQRLERNLAEVGVSDRYQRIAAVDGRAVAGQYKTKLDPGNLGLFLSHARVLEAAGDGKRHLHILEDDAVLGKDALNYLEVVLEQADEQRSDWDLLFTEIYVTPASLELFRILSGAVEKFRRTGGATVLDLKEITFSGTSSMFINRKSLDKYASLVAAGCKQKNPVDLFIRRQVHDGRLNALLTVPFLTTVSDDSLQSDITIDTSDARALTDTVLTALRRAFAMGADVAAIENEIQALHGVTGPQSRLQSLYLRTLAFYFSDKFVFH